MLRVMTWDTPVYRHIERIAERDGWECHYCGVPLIRREEAIYRPPMTVSDPGGFVAPEGYDWPQRDHVVPRSRGGSDDDENIVLACPGCNRRKGSKSLEEFLAVLAA